VKYINLLHKITESCSCVPCGIVHSFADLNSSLELFKLPVVEGTLLSTLLYLYCVITLHRRIIKNIIPFLFLYSFCTIRFS